MARIILVKPPWYSLQGSGLNEIPIGLSALAAFLRERGHEAVVFNADAGFRSGLEYRRLYANYDEYRALLRNLADPLWTGIADEIVGWRPDIVGISLCTGAYRSGCNIAILVKERLPNVRVVAGGPHATILPAETAREGCYDFVVKGEGEETFAELISCLDSSSQPSTVRGVAFLNGSAVVDTPDRPFIENLDGLPFLERDAHLHRETYNPSAFGLLVTARGCPYACSFCASERMWKRRVRFRSAASVLEEMRLVHRKYGTAHFKFRDDTFTVRRSRAMEICAGILSAHLPVTWQCDTRADCLDEELVKMMKRAGCIAASVGVESGSSRILSDIGKGETKEQMERGIRILRRHGINVTVFVMTGFPGESAEEMAETVRFARRLGPDHIVASILTPYPGTRMYEQCLDLGLIDGRHSWEGWFHQSPETGILFGRPEMRGAVEQFLSSVEAYNRSARRRILQLASRFVRNPRGLVRRAVDRLRRRAAATRSAHPLGKSR